MHIRKCRLPITHPHHKIITYHQHERKKSNHNNKATAPTTPIIAAGTALLPAEFCTGLTSVLEAVGVTVGFPMVYEKDVVLVGLTAIPVPVGRIVGTTYPPDVGAVGRIGETGVEAGGDGAMGRLDADGIIGDTGVEAAGGAMGALGGIIGETNVPFGGEIGGMIELVGPAGPSGCVPLWHPQSFGGLSAILTTAGIGCVCIVGAGRAIGPFGG